MWLYRLTAHQYIKNTISSAILDKFNTVFSGYDPRQVVKWRIIQHFEDHLCPCYQGPDWIRYYKVSYAKSPGTISPGVGKTGHEARHCG